MDNLSLFYSLLKSDSEEEIDEILSKENLSKFDTNNWKIFGGDDFANNKALVHGLSGRARPLHFDLTIVLGVLGRYKRVEGWLIFNKKRHLNAFFYSS